MTEACPKCGSTNNTYVSHFENQYGRTDDVKCKDCGELYSIDEPKVIGDKKE